MSIMGRHLSWKAGKNDAKILVEALHCLVAKYDDVDKLEVTPYFRYRWEENSLWVMKTTLSKLSNLTEKQGQKLEPEQIRNALHCLEALEFLEDKRGRTNSKTKTSSKDWCFVLKLNHQDKQENLYWLFGRKNEEGEWERRRIVNQNQVLSRKNEIISDEKLPGITTLNVCNYDPSFVGRESAIANLNTLVNEGKKLILIQAEGGIGKTTLARRYLCTQGFYVIEYPMAKERQNISSVESVVEEWLKRYFDEEPGREFGISLERLRNKLQDKNKKIGILIDNLEPALKNGKFIENHRRYVELLRVLNHPNVQSLTLITSREPIYESGIFVQPYPLEGLSKEAWNQFFESCRINTGSSPLDEKSALSLMHKAYGGNAEAMFIFSGAIKIECEGDLEVYWQKNHDDLLINPTLENLIEGQFKKLQHDNPKAYKLLCRLGCYRYQDVPLVPEEGIYYLLWEEEEKQRKRVIKALRDRSLIKCLNQEFYLHPVIKAEAIDRLRGSKDWEITNRKIAEFWTESVKHVTNRIEGLKRLEAYNHYVDIEDWENAVNILITVVNGSRLLAYLRAFGYLHKCLRIIKFLLNKPNLNKRYIVILRVHLAGINSTIGDFKKSIYEWKSLEKLITKKHNKNITENYILTIEECVDYRGAFALLYINMGDYNNAISILQAVLPIAKDLDDTGKEFIAYIYSCLSIANYLVGNHLESLIYLKEAINAKEYLEISSKTWIKIYGFNNLRKSLLYHYKLLESREICELLLKYYKHNSFLQAKGFSFVGFGDICFIERDFQKALDNYEKAIKIFIKIGSIYDKAETLYQIGLTHQKMGNNQQSHNNFQQAIQLFEEMEVPKQVEKVRQAM